MKHLQSIVEKLKITKDTNENDEGSVITDLFSFVKWVTMVEDREINKMKDLTLADILSDEGMDNVCYNMFNDKHAQFYRFLIDHEHDDIEVTCEKSTEDKYKNYPYKIVGKMEGFEYEWYYKNPYPGLK